MNLPKHPLFDELRKLALPAGEYAVFGSGPLWVRGIRESDDLDLVVRGEAWERVQASAAEVKETPDGRRIPNFADGKIEAYNDWYPGEWDIDELIDTAEIVGGVPFVRLEHVVRWKRLMGREKDKIDLGLIEKYLAENNE